MFWKKTQNKTLPIIVIVVGVLLSFIGIGVIVGIPLIIFGVYRLVKKPEIQEKSRSGFTEKIAKYKDEKKEFWNQKKILQFLLEHFEDSIEEDLFDDFEDYVKFRKDEMSTFEKIGFLLNNFKDEIEEDMFDDFDDYVEFRRAIKKMGIKW